MSDMKTAVVLTTIRVPEILDGASKNIIKYGHDNETEFIIIGDTKTPKEVAKYVDQISGRGIKMRYYDVQEQKTKLAKYQKAADTIPYASDARRNAGFLLAAEEGFDKYITLDDDNFPMEEDFVGQHNIIGDHLSNYLTVNSSNMWFNPCSMLETEPRSRIYQRGFPYSKRWNDKYQFTKESGKVVVNEGLWLSTPDADAITHIVDPVLVKKMTSEPVMLGKNVYAPINTQNTSFLKEVLPAFFFIPGEMIHNTNMNRLGDIWCGYFCQKVVQHMGHRVTIGKPLADHRRNTHNYPKDMMEESWGMYCMDALVNKLQTTELSSKSYAGAYSELGLALSKADFVDDNEMKKFWQKTGQSMQIWAETCESIIGT
jgi:hypothetical protein